ncbi:MAG: hypothetical protein PHT33_11725 [bacterium]|nr:hypothetical protein [bacterium]
MYSQEQLKSKLTEYRLMPSETEWLEFKEARNSFSFGDNVGYENRISINDFSLKIWRFSLRKMPISRDYPINKGIRLKLENEIKTIISA